jgi:hypothetical protein
MRSVRTVRALPIGAALLLLLMVLAHDSLAEMIEGPAFSTAVAVAGGLAVGAGLIFTLGARRSQA